MLQQKARMRYDASTKAFMRSDGPTKARMRSDAPTKARMGSDAPTKARMRSDVSAGFLLLIYVGTWYVHLGWHLALTSWWIYIVHMHAFLKLVI